ncbi:MAG TPA: Si-specific NAD(P)(+) transhydrogenase [Myxococcaceae bacterium]|nr:Si-specific NAD(P)(+) transhydrogenase [Myxococcaceae bacterium]
MGAPIYEVVVIGSGPAGQKGAINAAKLHKRVALIDRRPMLGGVSVHTGTIPSKTVREAILHLTGFTERTFYGRDYSLKENISVQDLAFRVNTIVERETQVIHAQLKRNGVAVFEGTARFIDPHTVEVANDDRPVTLNAERVLIACGTRPCRPTDIPFDGHRIIDTDQFHSMPRVPQRAIVVGAGVVGLEYASFLAALGAKVTLIDQRPAILDFVDREILEALSYHLRQLGMTFRLGERVTSVGFAADRERVFAELESGKRIEADGLLYAVGRQANGDQLNLAGAGLEVGPRGKVAVNDVFQTAVPHVYAAGDVIGFPALASTSMEQGRLATSHMFGAPVCQAAQLFPYGIYTIPEISMVGQTEEQLTAAKVPYEVGTAKYAELAKSMMLGDESGMLKILFHRKTLKLLGVHIIGERATEIIHVGQAVLSFGGTIEYFRDTVFNYPTLAEGYKVAAFDGLNKL